MDCSVALVTGAEAEAYRVLEVPAELEHAFESGASVPLTFNGRLVDDAVLTTPDATYTVREVTQSNSLLLCAVESADGDIRLSLQHTAPETLELVRVSPRLDRLSSLLDASAYAGEAADAPADLALTRRYKPNEVSSIVQASEAELAAGMRKYHVVELHGTSNQLQDA